jgi:hypothetical protein
MSYVVARSEYADLVREVRERLSVREESIDAWLENWQAEFDHAAADGDDESCGLLVDILVAYEHWQETSDAMYQHHAPSVPSCGGSNRG